MKTILEAKESIAHLWGYPKPKDVNYRWMKYLLKAETEDGVLLLNTVTRHMILLTEEDTKLLSELPCMPSDMMQELIANHFLVPEDYSEYKAVNQLRKIYQSSYTGNAINHFVVLPTTFCNAHCFYCYENDYPRIHMTEETAHRLVDYIAEHRKDKDVLISWFGGEPLVGIQRIDQISQELIDRGIPFKASMISNGYLFDEEIVKRAVQLWKLERIQITLDGTEQTYNQVKAYVNAQDNPYERVLRNIVLLSGEGVQVTIRLNVDFYNKDDIRTLIEELGERFSGNKHIAIYLNMLFNHKGYEPVHHSNDDRVELAEIIADYTKRLKELGFESGDLRLPSLEVGQCMADNDHTIEIQPDGGFCRCEHEDVRESYGNLVDGILDPQKPLKWKETIERSDYCPECSVYPACYLLRGCMNAELPCIDEFRIRNQDIHRELMKTIYYKGLEGKENERICSS